MPDQIWQPNAADWQGSSSSTRQSPNDDQERRRSAEMQRLQQQADPVTSAEALLERIRCISNWPCHRHSPDGTACPHSAALSSCDATSNSPMLHQHSTMSCAHTAHTPQHRLHSLRTAYSYPQRTASLLLSQHSTTATEHEAAQEQREAMLRWLQQSEMGISPQHSRGEVCLLSPISSGDVIEGSRTMNMLCEQGPVTPERRQACTESSASSPIESRLLLSASLQRMLACFHGAYMELSVNDCMRTRTLDTVLSWSVAL